MLLITVNVMITYLKFVTLFQQNYWKEARMLLAHGFQKGYWSSHTACVDCIIESTGHIAMYCAATTASVLGRLSLWSRGHAFT